MTRRLFSIALLAATASPALAEGPGSSHVDPKVATPPVARKVPRTIEIHGETRVDDYFWLREKKNPEVIAHLEAENAYTKAVMAPTESLQKVLYDEMVGRIKETDLDVPVRRGDAFYYSRTEKGKQYPILCRKKGSLDAAEEVILDENELAKGEKFLSVNPVGPSDDGNLYAYSVDTTGFRQYTLRVKDLRTGQLLPEKIEQVAAATWASDGSTVLYVREDAAKRPYRVHRHALGSTGDDPIVYEEKDELFRASVARSRDKKYLFLGSISSTTTEFHLVPADRPAEPPRVVVPREDGHRYFVNHRDGLLYIQTDKGAKEFRLVTAPVADPRPENWKELIPQRPGITLDGIALFARFGVLTERDGGNLQHRVIDFRDGGDHRIAFAEPAFLAMLGQNPEYDADVIRLSYTSLVTPMSVYDYDMVARKLVLKKQTEVKGYDPSLYASERIEATAADGTKVPISLVYKKGLKRDGTAPMLLYGYGSYGAPTPPAFSSPRLSLLDRGVTFAMAHIRGGGDLGKAWHDAGKMMAKKTTFTDFVAAADHLVAEKYTSHERLAIQGASAGGLLIGATVNLRPDLAKVAVLQVPFVDVVNTMLDASLPLTIQEYLEWGNPNKKDEYDYLKTYCPYSNLAAGAYPSTLVLTSLNDSQVMYWEPAKYVAKLRTLRTDANPLVFKCNMDAGHGGASGRYDALKETAFVDAFVLDQLGVE